MQTNAALIYPEINRIWESRQYSPFIPIPQNLAVNMARAGQALERTYDALIHLHPYAQPSAN